jgi:GNAT superfamily N-acetyltransferase
LSPPAFAIRDFEEGDGAAVLALLRELQAFEQPFDSHLKPPHLIDDTYLRLLQQNCRDSHGAILLAMAGADVVGLAVVLARLHETGDEELEPHDYAFVTELVVRRDQRGQGIGTALLAACEARARHAGASEIAIAAFAANHAARQLYAAQGYDDHKIKMRKALS